MKPANPDLEHSILDAAFDLILERGLHGVGMRDIARRCGVTATTLYYYYRDKNSLIEAVKLRCLTGMAAWIGEHICLTDNSLADLKSGLVAFRDWCFLKPAEALLVMSGFMPNPDVNLPEMERYYRSVRLAVSLLERAIQTGHAVSHDPVLDSSVCIATLWGAVESVLAKRSLPEFWERGIEFTDRAIEICIGSVTRPAGEGV